MRIKMIAFDLDGTVLRTDKSVSRRTVEALSRAAAQGCVVLPASGRVASNIPEEVLSFPGVRFLLTSNGASVIDRETGTTVYTNLMTEEETGILLRRLYEEGCFVEAYRGGKAYSDRLALPRLHALHPSEDLLAFLKRSQIFVDDLPQYAAEHSFRLEKVNVPMLPSLLAARLNREFEAGGMFSTCSSFPGNIEVNRAGCSKGAALEHLCNRLGIDREEVMTLGDSGNDLAMLRFAGLGVAVKNATPEILAAADFVTAANDEDGAALAVERFVLA